MTEITREKLCNVMRYLILLFTFIPYFLYRLYSKIKVYFRRVFFYDDKFLKMFKSNKRIKYKKIFRPQIIYVIFSFITKLKNQSLSIKLSDNILIMN